MPRMDKEANSPQKFQNSAITAKGEPRAYVEFTGLETLWFNTGTLCNLACEHCYIESSPTNDSLSYLTLDDFHKIMDQISPPKSIGLTGGEPFINPSIVQLIEASLRLGCETLILTNACGTLERHKKSLNRLHKEYPNKLILRVSLDHYTQERHETERGRNTFQKTLSALKWASSLGLNIHIAGRKSKTETDEIAKQKYLNLFLKNDIDLGPETPIILFPEMDPIQEVPEISVSCWDIVGAKPEHMMCASQRMVVKAKGDLNPSIRPCTLLSTPDFDLGEDLESALKPVFLNHPFCAQFCVLGGSSCSA